MTPSSLRVASPEQKVARFLLASLVLEAGNAQRKLVVNTEVPG
jgi:hypothetical protein